jgi:hypothetical protein
MDRKPLSALLLSVGVCLALPARSATALSSPARTERLTGCLDELPGPQYVLRDARELQVVAVLEPAGFSVQSFAKYLGHRVTVTGRRTSKDGKSVMSVRAVRSLATTCTASPPGHPAPAGGKLSASMTASGCLDEEPGPRYVLRREGDLELLMQLEPNGFPVQNFARYLGHRVELRGRTYSENEKTAMRVTGIRSLADRCTPQ